MRYTKRLISLDHTNSWLLSTGLSFKINTPITNWSASQKIAGSIIDGIIEIVQLVGYNPTGCNMALWCTQPLTEMSTGAFLGAKEARRADNLTGLVCRLSEKWVP